MRNNPEITLFKSPLVRIIEYRCYGEDTCGSHEEAADGNQISFPRYGVYKKRNQDGEFLVDANHVSFFKRGQPYQVHHPIKDHHAEKNICDISTVFEISDDVLDQMIKRLGHYYENEPSLPDSTVKVNPSIKAYHYFILKTFNHLKSDEIIEFEENVLDFLYAVLAASSDKLAVSHHCCNSNRTQAAHNELVEQVKLVIGKDYRSKLSLDDIAQQVHHTSFSLSRIFKNHTGTTIHKYLLRTRLLLSLEQIMSCPSEYLGKIGVDYGFATPSHFATAFLEEFNTSPSVFRQRAGSNQIGKISNFLKA